MAIASAVKISRLMPRWTEKTCKREYRSNIFVQLRERHKLDSIVRKRSVDFYLTPRAADCAAGTVDSVDGDFSAAVPAANAIVCLAAGGVGY
jgi:hypothetical protein